MKAFKHLLTLLLTVSIFTSAYAQDTRAQRKAEKEAAEASIAAQVDSLLQSKTFTIEITRILPMSGPSIMTSDGYNLKIIRDTVETYLPYFGSSTGAAFTPGGNISIDIEEQPSEIKIEKAKKDKYIVTFKCNTRNTNERCEFRIDIFTNGSASINLRMTARDPISYLGNIREINN